MTLEQLNALDEDAAVRELLRCCGSSRWARSVAAARPFVTFNALAGHADSAWWALDRADWLEAFAAHQRIGAGEAGEAGGAGEAGRAGTDWSTQEQSGVADQSRAQFAALNREYESRFGHIFIVCATGKSGDEMLRILEERMLNNRDDELREAAEQQRQITRLRLAKLLTSHNS